MGIVIDPGYSFITLFLESGRPDRGVSVEDIDYLIVTHDHPDHCDELPRIITLLFEFNDRHNSEHKIEIITSYGVYFKYRELFENREVREVINVQRKLPGATINFPDEYDMKLKCLRARHKELLGDETSFGLKFTLSPSSSNPFTLCITGDTKFDARLVQQYEDADLLVAHIGSMEEIGAKTYYFKSHLGFCGVVDLLKKLHKKPKLTLISEWGEEFMSRRYETTKLIEAFSQVQPVLPADTHLCVRIRDGNLGFLEDVPGQPIRRRFAPPNQVSIDDMGSKLIYK
jgi:hypothetical protein